MCFQCQGEIDFRGGIQKFSKAKKKKNPLPLRLIDEGYHCVNATECGPIPRPVLITQANRPCDGPILFILLLDNYLKRPQCICAVGEPLSQPRITATSIITINSVFYPQKHIVFVFMVVGSLNIPTIFFYLNLQIFKHM